MKQFLKFIKFCTEEILNSLLKLLTSAFFPISEVILEFNKKVLKILDINSSLINDFIKSIKISKEDIKLSFIIYYLILLFTEIYILVNILLGIIYYFDFITLFIYSIIVLFFNIVFVLFLNNHYKSKKFNYIIYFQILFLLPLIVVYWIANIEGHDLYLKNLNSDQWISLFNTIIIYFSGCLIGIVTLYKNKEK